MKCDSCIYNNDNMLIGVENSPDYGITDIVWTDRFKNLDAKDLVYVIDKLEICLKYCDDLLKEKTNGKRTV